MTSKRFQNRRDNLYSPVPALLDNNVAPTETEINQVRHAMTLAKERLAAVAMAVDSDTTSCSSWPKSSRGHLHSFIQAHESVLAPVRRLPYELLAQIFDSYMENGLSSQYTSPPWILGHICKSWRVAALSTPSLWTRFHLTVDKNISEHRVTYALLPAYTTILQRSSNYPLSFYYKQENDGPATVILKIIFDCAERWEDVKFVLPESVAMHFCRVKHRLGRLRSLAIRLDDGITRLTLDMFTEAPKLEHIVVERSVLSGPTFLAWKQLRSFVNRRMEVTALYNVLVSEERPNLQTLGFSTECTQAFLGPVGPLLSKAIPFPNLTTLILLIDTTMPNAILTDAVANLHLPSLTTLALAAKAHVRRGFVERNLLEMIRKSGCTLTRIVLSQGSDRLDPSVILEILSQSPFCTDLVLHDPHPELVAAIAAKTTRSERITNSIRQNSAISEDQDSRAYRIGQWVTLPNLTSLDVFLSTEFMSFALLVEAIRHRFGDDGFSLEGKARVALSDPRLSGQHFVPELWRDDPMSDPSIIKYHEDMVKLWRNPRTSLQAFNFTINKEERHGRQVLRMLGLMVAELEKMEVTPKGVAYFYVSRRPFACSRHAVQD